MIIKTPEESCFLKFPSTISSKPKHLLRIPFIMKRTNDTNWPMQHVRLSNSPFCHGHFKAHKVQEIDWSRNKRTEHIWHIYDKIIYPKCNLPAWSHCVSLSSTLYLNFPTAIWHYDFTQNMAAHYRSSKGFDKFTVSILWSHILYSVR